MTHAPWAPVCLASACLCGAACRYDGSAAVVERLAALHAQGLVLAVCPEVEGGLPVPRPPCELRVPAPAESPLAREPHVPARNVSAQSRAQARVLTLEGTDLTEQFEAGAARALRLAREYGLRLAVFKERSPSCGVSMVYDGTFSGRRVPGQGIATALLRRHGIRVVSEADFHEALEELLRR